MGTDYNRQSAKRYSEELEVDRLSLRPIIEKMINKVSGKKVLDFGCGSGRFSKLMAEKGASVNAIDNSKFQIELSKEINSHSNITYDVGDVGSLLKFKEDTFDLILMNMVLPSFDDKESAKNTFKEIARVLKEEGILIVSTLHPLFLSNINKANDRITDFDWRNYFNEGHIYEAQASTTKGNVMTFRETHFSLNFISEMLQESGLCIKRIKEGRQVIEKNIFVPIYIIFECKKI